MHCVQKEETIGIALTGHAFSGSVRQLTRGIPSLVPVPRNMISEVLSLRLPPLGNSTPNNPSTNAPDSAASCQTSNLRLTHIPLLSTTSFNIAMQGNALYSCENPQISFRFLPDFTPLLQTPNLQLTSEPTYFSPQNSHCNFLYSQENPQILAHCDALYSQENP